VYSSLSLLADRTIAYATVLRPFVRRVSVTYVFRYDTIEEFNVDSKAEYSALSSTRT